jgi:C-terminal processing protease CtpA/Prc
MKSLEALIVEMKNNKTDVLIVDLRGNTGGDGKLPYQLLKKIISKPVLESPGGRLIRPVSNGWNGKIVLLCDRLTGSAAVYPAVIVKDSKAGIIAGEETGGRASYFGNVHSYNLPNSGLRFIVSTAYFMRPGGYDDGCGVMPDLVLDVTLEEGILVEKIYDYLKETNIGGNKKY